ncbi:LlaJI family restriction endonuclease [Hymenobacter sp. BT175]|uniref:LlaJI family restriction endonuclease n=1 Tax=Hymenobacter translucens TaxID=2886507 RepID=UPI001D0DC602|nr:LlaJI family restriction endonuclease [Hymenobacter translucens]MCC2548537.1 LlaJI family restriction endonuclease [Hymenobacter translucens]
MNIVFEGYTYPSNLLRTVLSDAYIRELSNGQAQVIHIGYLGPTPGVTGAQAVVMLPKVFLSEDNKALGIYEPEHLLQLSTNPELRAQLAHSGTLEFLFRISVWLYQSIGQFARRKKGTDLIQQTELHIVSREGGPGRSALEVIQSLLHFYRENQSLLTFIKRYNTNQQRTVNWSRTVNRTTPFIQNGTPVYSQPIVKQQHINYDEELIRIFVSTLADLKAEYGFRIEITSVYEPLTRHAFRKFKQAPTRHLKQIRGRYFNDQLVRLWNLLHLYYEQAEQLNAQISKQEKTLVRNFNIVFEDMIDSLLSDPFSSRMPARLKTQQDDKIIDHLYEYKDLTSEIDTIYHIGDSKYYKIGAPVGKLAVYKQYTYARNLIFENIKRLNKGSLPTPLRYRDELTEGYNPTPNFFISASYDKKLSFSTPGLQFKESHSPSYHFHARLFDRDTLLLQQYDINFLYVITAYVSPKASEIARFQSDAHKRFREQLLHYLADEYAFFELQPLTGTLDEYVTINFRKLIGRMYRPSGYTESMLVAIPHKESAMFKAELSRTASLNDWSPKMLLA